MGITIHVAAGATVIINTNAPGVPATLEVIQAPESAAPVNDTLLLTLSDDPVAVYAKALEGASESEIARTGAAWITLRDSVKRLLTEGAATPANTKRVVLAAASMLRSAGWRWVVLRAPNEPNRLGAAIWVVELPE